jgi:aminopeptidase N
VPAGLTVDTELRWSLLQVLAANGAVGAGEIDAELAGDRTASGQQWAARCRAALADPAAKRRAWQLLMADTSVSGRLVESTAESFWHPEQVDLTAEYVPRYFEQMPDAARRRTAWISEQVALLAYPSVAVERSTREAAARLLARPDLEPGLRRAVIDADDELGRALVAHTRFAG